MNIRYNCKICGKFAYVPKHKLKVGRGKFCSRSCANKLYKFKTGKHVNYHGYTMVWCPKHPQASRGYVHEHRLVIEKSLGRYLMSNELVHHLNHDRKDNRVENLQLTDRRNHPFRIHREMYAT